jgi:F-type H+-transporting ATPase subunit gamma
MELISRTKYQRSVDSLNYSRDYLMEADGVLARLISDHENSFFETNKEPKNIAVFIVSADTGFCSSYNHSILTFAEKILTEKQNQNHQNCQLFLIGKKGLTYFKEKNFVIKNAYLGLHGKLVPEILNNIVNDISIPFLKKDFDEVFVVYTKFHSTIKTEPVCEKILPIQKPVDTRNFYIEESNIDKILEKFISNFILAKLKNILLESFVSEHVTRMVAMKIANDNAKDILESLILTLNKTRQALITRELIEIISSSEAMKE